MHNIYLPTCQLIHRCIGWVARRPDGPTAKAARQMYSFDGQPPDPDKGSLRYFEPA